MPSDWLKLHRKALDSQVFSNPELWHLFCWCLLRANWKPGFYLGETIPAGSFATGRDAASSFLSINGATWYKRMKKLESLGVISLKSNNRFTVVTVEKWADYQSKEESSNNEVTADEQQSNNEVTTKSQRSSTIEEGKKDKKGRRKDIIPPADFLAWWENVPNKDARGSAAKSFETAILKLKIEKGLERSEAVSFLTRAVQSFTPEWQRMLASGYKLQPTTWLNQERYLNQEIVFSGNLDRNVKHVIDPMYRPMTEVLAKESQRG